MIKVVHIRRLLVVLVFVSLFLAATWQNSSWSVFSAPSARITVENAWENANDIGVYAYQTNVQQTTRPLPKLINMGLSSSTDNFYVEGSINAPEDAMTLKIWAQGGNLTNAQDSLEIKIAEGEAMGRVGQGEWEKVDNVSDLFAPGGDPLGFLNAATNIEHLGTESKVLPWLAERGEGDTELHYDRYQFELDGLAYATYMRDQMETQLRQKGELPSGVHLDLVRQYIDTTGNGEIWVDENGLPLRQIINLTFPPDVNEQVSAQIKTDFYAWGPQDLESNAFKAVASSFNSLIFGENTSQVSLYNNIQEMGAWLNTHLLQSLTRSLPWVMAVAILGLFFALIIHYRNSPKLYNVMALAVMISMLFTPLLHTNQVVAFNDRINTEKTDREGQELVRNTIRELQDEVHQSDWNPNIDPLALPTIPQTELSIEQTDTDNDGVSDDIEIQLGINPNNPDSDGDGLTDGVEVYQLSTDPLAQDSDGDGLSDQVEVQGFRSRDGLRWYLNPLDLDTNRDGQADGIECPTGYGCPDTDADGIPDAFDFDDDNDDVPDTIDVSVNSLVRTNNQQEYQIQIDNLTPGKAAFVDFQLRPTDPNHLWYALNVLDWPGNDFEGQVQSHVEGVTFGTSGNEANGDMKLIPMLEIEIPYQAGHYGNLPVKPGAPAIGPTTPVASWLDTTKTEPYGISVKKKDNDGTLLVYVPVNMVRNPVGEAVVAFSARMAYWPSTNTFGKSQTARLAWLVRAKVTDPNTKSIVERTIHTYYDEWYLTGLAVREDLGVNAGVIFENPDFSGKNPNYEASLWTVADRLNQSFMAGRRDVNITTIKNRFDKDSNAAASNTERWGIPAQALQVKTFAFSDQTGLGTLPTSGVQTLLDQNLTNKVESATLLFVREETFRVANLDQGNGVVNQSGNQITVNLDSNLVKPQVLAGMNWAPYRHKGAGIWESYPISEYWQAIDSGYTAVMPLQAGKADVQAGQVLMAKSYYLSLLQGTNAIVQNGNISVTLPEKAEDDELEIDYNYFDPLVKQSEAVTEIAVKAIMAAEIRNSFQRATPLTVKEKFLAGFGGVKDALSQELSVNTQLAKLEEIGKTLKQLDNVGKAKVAAGAVAGLGAMATLTVLSATGVIGLDQAIEIVQAGIAIATALYELYEAVTNIGEVVGSAVAQASRTAGVVGLIVAGVTQVGIFLFSVLSGGFAFGSELFNQALASLAATIVFAALMFAINAIPIVGQVIVAVLALIDAVILAVCAIIGADGGICEGIAGTVIAALAGFFYSSSPSVDMQHKNRLIMSNFDIQPQDPTKGYAVANDLRVSIDVTSNLYVKDRDSDALVSNMQYRIQVGSQYDFHSNLQKTQMSPQWVKNADYRFPNPSDFNNLTALFQAIPAKYSADIRGVNGRLSVPVAGINQRLSDVWLAEAYAIDVQKRCLLFRCGSSTDRGTNHFKLSPSGGLKFDVFPRTLNGFYNLQARGQNSWALSWTDSLYAVPSTNFCNSNPTSLYCASGVAFPTLADADGDGLRSQAAFGNDPDDSNPDIDNDRLSDFYERQNGLNPALADTDFDGLLDYDEVRLGTNPLVADSDGDGLTDKQEVDGWLFTYAPGQTTLVTSDPMEADTDGDGSNDALERDRGTNPRSSGSGGSFGVAGLQLDKAFVAPGQPIQFTAELENNYRFDTVLFGNLQVDFSEATEPSNPQAFYLNFGQSQTLNGDFVIPASIAQSQPAELTAHAFSNLNQTLGNPPATIAKFTIDADKPSINLSGSNVFYRPQDLVLAFEASDPTSAVAQAEVSLDGGTIWREANRDGRLWFFTLPATGENTTIQLRATDLVGNVSDVTQATLTVDSTAPSGSINIPSSILTPQQGTTIYLTGTQGDANQSGVASGSIRLLDGAGVALTDPQDCCGGSGSTWEAAFVLPGNIQGAYTPELTLVDALGNKATYTASATIQIDSRAPLANLSQASVSGNKLQGTVFDINIPTNPALLFHFEQTSSPNKYLDSSSNLWVAECSNCPSSVPGKVGQGLIFDQTPSFLEIPHNPKLNPNYGLTMAAWVNMPDVNGDKKIMGKTNTTSGYLLGVINGNLVPEIWGVNGYQRADWPGVPSGQWVHLAVTFATEGHMIGYINGVEVGRTPVGDNPIKPNAADFIIGAAPWDPPALPFQGDLDEVVLYDRPLAASEIAILAEDSPTSTQLDRLYISLQNTADQPTATSVGGVQYNMPFNEDFSNASASIINLAGGNGAFCYNYDTASINCPETVPGILGNAFEFNGVNDSIRVPTTSSGSWKLSHTSHTLAYWFKTDCLSCGLSSFSESGGGHDRHIYLKDGNLCSRVWSEEVICTSGINYADGAWHHLAHTFGGASGGQRIYVDGLEKASGNKSNSDFTWAREINLGYAVDAGRYYFRGSMDDVRYYHRALSADEVQALVGPTYKDDPILYLALEEADTTTTGGSAKAFFDIAGQQNAFCQTPACPTLGQPGKFGRSLSFDGDPNKVLTLGTSEELGLANQSFTAMAWVKFDTLAGRNILFGSDVPEQNKGLHLSTLNDKAYFGVYGNDTLGQTSLQTGQWYHLTWRYDNQQKTQSIFVNGTLDAIRYNKLPFIEEGNVYLGRALTTFGMQGSIDEAKIYNRALNDSEIAFQADTNRWREISYATGDGIFGTWSEPFPAGLEGTYDLHIRAVDKAGQVQEIPNLWRGEVDNVAPRILDRGLAQWQYPDTLSIPYVGRALFGGNYSVQDLNLKLEGYTTFSGYYYGHYGYKQMNPTETLNGRTTGAKVYLTAAPIPDFTTEFINGQTVPKGTVPGSVVCDIAGNCTAPINLDSCTFQWNFQGYSGQSMRCDLSGTTQAQALTLSQTRLAQQTTPTVTLYFPPTLNSTSPVTFDFFVRSLSYVKALTFTIDGAVLDTFLWPADSVTQTVTTTTRTPASEGRYTLNAILEDWSGAIVVVTDSILVDATPPSVSISTTQITGDNLSEDGILSLSGAVSDTLGLQIIEARVNSDTWQLIPLPTLTQTWGANIATGLSEPVENLPLTLTVRAYNQAGGVVTATKMLTVNTLVPSPFTVTAAYQGNTTPITAGMTLFDTLSPTVTLNWTPAFTFDNVILYRAGWSTARELSAEQIAQLTVYGPGDLSHSETLSDGQRLYAHVIAETASGTRQIESFQQPLYIDYQLTPTYINFDDFGGPYRGWLDNTCSLLGVDNRLSRNAEGVAVNTLPQQFYSTWDADGLQMTWTGANWATEGDLFIYLDTQPGGSIRAYNPYTATQGNTRIVLPVQNEVTTQARQDTPARIARLQANPNQMAADYVVWVQERTEIVTQSLLAQGSAFFTDTSTITDSIITTTETYTASILAWDEVSASWQAVSGSWNYSFTFVDGLPITDIYLPFALLGIADPATASLDMVALASENDALRLWATMPNRNPVNSQRVVDAIIDPSLQRFALTERYTWSSLGNDVCANTIQTVNGQTRLSRASQQAVQHTGADVTVKLSADPVGVAYSVLNDDYYFIQEDLNQFSDLVDWPAELQALCTATPNHPDCDRSVPDNSNIDINPTDALGNIVDAEHPLLGDGQVIEYTLQLSNDGLGASTGLVIDMDTWGPLTLPDGTYISDTFDGEFWEWYNLEAVLGDLAPGEVMTFTFIGVVETGFDENNNEGFATLDMIIYDDTGDLFTNNIDWLYMDHPIDDSAPAYVEIQSHQTLIGPGENTFSGFVLDYSPVPTITLRITDTQGQLSFLTCIDDTPADGQWACPWDAGGAANGDVFRMDIEPIDSFGQAGDWSADYNVFYTFTVDAISPIITASQTMQAAFSDGLIGINDTLLSGQVSDNHLVSGVEVCNTTLEGESCEQAALTFNTDVVVQQTYIYTDAPTNPIPINAANACEGGTRIIRTFTVPDSFIVADVDFGLNLDHEFRHDLIVDLISPAGTNVTLVSDNNEADNYDVLLNDAVTLLVADDEANHNTQPPYYENERSSYDYLSEFNNEAAQGTWTLDICDFFPEEDDGAYNHSQLILRSKATPTNTSAEWAYTLPLGEEELDSTYNLRIYGLDSVGNRSTAPISFTYLVDTTAPVITITQQTNRLQAQINSVLGGTVSDASDLTRMSLRTLTPDEQVLSQTLTLQNSAWSVSTQTTFSQIGTYRLWVEAEDVLGNRSTLGPFEVQSSTQQLYLPLVLR